KAASARAAQAAFGLAPFAAAVASHPSFAAAFFPEATNFRAAHLLRRAALASVVVVVAPASVVVLAVAIVVVVVGGEQAPNVPMSPLLFVGDGQSSVKSA